MYRTDLVSVKLVVLHYINNPVGFEAKKIVNLTKHLQMATFQVAHTWQHAQVFSSEVQQQDIFENISKFVDSQIETFVYVYISIQILQLLLREDIQSVLFTQTTRVKKKIKKKGKQGESC